jgi:Transposase DDE domain
VHPTPPHRGGSRRESVALFGEGDAFCQHFEPAWQQRPVTEGSRQRLRESRLWVSEGMTMVITFHHSGDRTFKGYCLRSGTAPLRWAFPQVVSYPRFVELRQEARLPLCSYLQPRQGRSQGGAFIASTLLAVCPPKRAARPQGFAGLARWGRSSRGWWYGFKLPLLLNEVGDLLACHLTAAKAEDRVPVPALGARRSCSQIVDHRI